uniref:Uncharacterized protein n=1 Tax=Arion vulgaris TaxID=1028688 RepID=A0A0B7BHM1_9EUPU
MFIKQEMSYLYFVGGLNAQAATLIETMCPPIFLTQEYLGGSALSGQGILFDLQ